MALDLERYYEVELPNRQALRVAVEMGIQQVLDLISTVMFDQHWAWPYFVGEEAPTEEPKAFSQSTTSMIAAAIQGAHDRARQRAAHGYRWHKSSQLPKLTNTEFIRRLSD
jgi:hypothetical protein